MSAGFGQKKSGGGSSPTTATTGKQVFECDGVNQVFVVTLFQASNTCVVFLDSVLMDFGYTQVGNTFTFAVAPPDGSKITIKN